MSPFTPSASGPVQYRRTLVVLRVLIVASILLPLIILVGGGSLTWHQQRRDASDETARLLSLVTDSSAKLFDAQLLALDQARQLVGDRDDDDLIAQQHELHVRLASMLHYLPFLRDIFVINRFGHVIVSGNLYPSNAAYSLSDRDFFQFFRDGGTGRFIGRLAYRHSDGQSFVPIAVIRSGAGGSFSGVLVATINPDFFEQFFRQILSTYPDFDGRSMSLRRDDGQLVARSQQLPPSFDMKASIASAELAAKADAQVTEVVSTALGETRFVAWQRLPNLGLMIFTSVSLTGIVRGWMMSMIPYAALCLCVALSLFSISLVALRRTEEAIAAEQDADAERRRREQAEEAIRISQKMEALGKLTGGVAHDFNNLLAVIQGNAELAKTQPPDRVKGMLDNILHASRRGATLTRQLLSFSRGHALAPKALDPSTELMRMMDMLRTSLQGSIDLRMDVRPDVWCVEADPAEWEIAMLNIAVNARDVMPDGGRLTVTVRNDMVRTGQIPSAPELSGAFVKVAVTDTGPGIASDVADRAFEPFYTTKDVGRGTGLGLSQVYGFARQAGGAATIGAGPAGGTTVTLYLPRTTKPLTSNEEAGQPVTVAANVQRRILLVEDNQEVAAIMAELIRSLGYDVVQVDRAQAALEQLNDSSAPFQLVITDVIMPEGMSGMDLARTVRNRMPNLPVILVSGYNEVASGNSAGFRLLRKPLPVDELAQAIQTEIEPIQGWSLTIPVPIKPTHG